VSRARGPVDRRLLRISPAARLYLGACVPLGLATALTIVVQATLLGRIVDDVFLHRRGLSAESTPLALLAAAAVARGLLAWAFEAGGHLAATATMSALRRTLVCHALADRPGDPALSSGEVAAAATSGVDALDPYFSRYLPQLVLGVVVPVAILLRVVTLDVSSAIVMAATVPLIPIFGILVGRTTQERARSRYRALARLSTHFLDVVRGLTTLRAFNRGAAQADMLAASGEAYRRETMSTLRVAFLSALVLELAATLGTAVVAVEIGIRLDRGGIGLASALTILVLAPELYAPLRSSAAQFHASADGVAAADRILSRVAEAPAIDVRGAAPLGARDVPVRLDRVSFAYPARDGLVLDDVTLSLAPGERVALIGPSGAGKSTIVRLLLGFDRPGSGRVLVGATDLATLDLDRWRTHIAWVPQRPHLASSTIGGAICLGSPRASSTEIADAARSAGAEEFIAALPDGYDTRVGDGGISLSAGQIRRVALARALLRDPALLILDEPTTSLDHESAERVADALERLPRAETMLLITHDADLAARIADRVLSICDGRIVDPVGATS
jgi:thiol reductant ABC exporter CydD subunit